MMRAINGRRIWLAVIAIAAVTAAPAQADDFWNSLTNDLNGLTDAITGGIEAITEGKKSVDEITEGAGQLKDEFAGVPDEPRYDAAWVLELQQRLTALGFAPGPIDGAFGNRTSSAIAAFQQQAGSDPDGLPRASIMRALRARTQGTQMAQPLPPPLDGQAQPSSGSLGLPASTAGATVPTGQTIVTTPSFGQVPSQVSGQVPNLPTASQDATYARFLEAHLALHPEVAADEAFALQYLSYLPADQECPVEFELLEGDEFARQRFFTQVWPAWKARFEEAVSQARPPGGEVFRARVESAAGAYDFARQAFAVAFADPGAEVVVGQAHRVSYPRSGMRFCTSPSGPGRFPVGFAIDLGNAEAINGLPLTGPDAEAFGRRNPDRKLQFVVDFVLEQTAEAGSAGGAGQGTGRIVGAAAVDPVSGQILYRYDPSIFAPPSADPWDAFPAPDYRQLLSSLVARSPELAQDDAYVEQFIGIQACDALRETKGNEIRRRQLIAKWRPGLEQEAAAARDQRPPIVKVTLEQRLDAYDPAEQAFRFPDSGGLNRHNSSSIQVRGAWCPTASNDAPSGFWMLVEPPEALFQAGLPVAPDIAQRLLDQETRGRARTVHLDLLLALGTPGEIDGNPSRVPATIVDARVREFDAPEVLHHYGTAFFDAQAAPADPYAGIEEPSHERLTLTYLAAQPQLADDPSFAQRYAAATHCEAWEARRGDEFARRELGDQARQQIRDALAQGYGQPADARYRVSIEAELGAYDFADQRFPLEVPIFDQQIYRNLLEAPLPAVLIEHDGKACRRDAPTSPSFPDGFLLTLAGAKAIDAAGLPVDEAAAKAFLQRELPPYRDPRAVQIEMVVESGEIGRPQRTHPQRDERVSVVAGTVVSARVLDAHSGRLLLDYGTALFEGAAAPPPVLSSASEVVVPEGAEFVLVSLIDAADVEVYTVMPGSGFERQQGQRINGRPTFDLRTATDPHNVFWQYGKKAGVVLSAAQLADVLDAILDLDPKISPLEPPALPTPASGPAVATLEDQEPPGPAPADLTLPSTATATEQPADQRSADDFEILNVTVGMTEAEASAAIAAEFSPDQIVSERGALRASRGPCKDADPGDPAMAGAATASEVGAFCLALQLTDGRVTRVALRQVVPGDVAAAALAAFGERYGEPVFLDPGDLTRVGWGARVGADRAALGRVAGPAQATVLEANIWHANGVTTAVLRLDGELQQAAAAPALEIKF